MDLVTRGVGKDWQDWALREVRKVTVEDVQAVLRDVVGSVFVADKADVVVTCGGIMSDVSLSYPFPFVGIQMLIRSCRISRKTSKKRGSSRRSSSSSTSRTHTASREMTTMPRTRRCSVAATMVVRVAVNPSKSHITSHQTHKRSSHHTIKSSFMRKRPHLDFHSHAQYSHIRLNRIHTQSAIPL